MQFDAVVIGAGAAGLFCAGIAGQRGLKVLLVDHSEKIAEKIRISGGGRCNFTNRDLDPRPALVPLTFEGADWSPYSDLAGLALPVTIETGAKKERVAFNEDLLFTHRGLSGPAVLQISSYWRESQPIRIDLTGGADIEG